MIKNSRIIYSENPEIDLWRNILQFTYENNVIKYLNKRGFSTDEKIVDSIIGSFLQAHEYYKFAKEANLQTAPLLLYYGTSNLLYGMVNMMSGEIKYIKDHGMRINNIPTKETFISETNIRFFDLKSGGVHVIARELGFKEELTQLGDWKLSEFLDSIAEINQEYIQCYDVDSSNIIMLDVFDLEDGKLEKVYFNEKNKAKLEKLLRSVEEIDNSYLDLRIGHDREKNYFILRHKINGSDISNKSYSGQPYLKAPHYKRGKKITIPTILNMYIVLFALSSLCRYHPDRWSPFVLKDVTGEKLLIENLLYYSRRMIPNMVLNNILGEDVQYVSYKYKDNKRV